MALTLPVMRDHEVSHVLVVGRSSRPIGIVSTLDVMAVAGKEPR
jgi:CBS domain-containing protein